MVENLETHFDAPPPDWNETVCRLDGSIYQSAAWADYEKTRNGARPLYLLTRDSAGEAVAGTLAFVQQSKHPLISWMSRAFRLPAHPFVRKDRAGIEATNLIAQCEKLARRLGCNKISMDSFLSGHSELVPADLGYAESRRIEFCVDLTGNLDEVWKGVKKDHRERIRRLKREDIRIEVATARADLEVLKSAREMTRERREEKGQTYEVEHSAELYDRLQDELMGRGLARLLIAKRENEILGSICFLTFNGRANSIFSGSTAAGYKMGVQALLFWSAVETFKADGFRELNRGGVPASAAEESDTLHGIYRFKSRLGTTPFVCRSGEKILRPLMHRISRLRHTLRH
jgi:lipid II:glycine glycyltransferase (peptidoglycan interpeptide bridge formation enzyme)